MTQFHAPRGGGRLLAAYDAPGLVVVVLVAAAVRRTSCDLGQRLGVAAPDPATEPAAVAPPPGLELPGGGAGLGRGAGPRPLLPTRAAVPQPLGSLPLARKLGRRVAVAVSQPDGDGPLYTSGASRRDPRHHPEAAHRPRRPRVARVPSTGSPRPWSARAGGSRWSAAATRCSTGRGPTDAYPQQRRPHHAGPADRASARGGWSDAGAARLRHLALHRPGRRARPGSPTTSPTTWSARSPRSGSTRAGSARGCPAAARIPRGRGAVFATALGQRGSTSQARPGRRPARRRDPGRRGAERSARRRSSSTCWRSATTRAPRCWRATSALAQSGERLLRRRGAQRCEPCSTELGIRLAGAVIHDGSGLSRDDRLSAGTLLDVLRRGVGRPPAAHRGQRAAGGRVHRLPGLPLRRLRRDDALGEVRAKTGTLTGVARLRRHGGDPRRRTADLRGRRRPGAAASTPSSPAPGSTRSPRPRGCAARLTQPGCGGPTLDPMTAAARR